MGRKGVTLLLTLLPLWLVVSTVGGWLLWNRGRENRPEPSKFQTALSVDGLAADLRKLAEVAGPRHGDSERGATGLRRASAMIQGTLGPGNAGYVVELLPGLRTDFGTWPVIVARLQGEGRPIVWITAYDSPSGSTGVEHNATGTASLLAAAQALAGESMGRPVGFVWVPVGYGNTDSLARMQQRLQAAIGDAEAVIWLEAMGRQESLRWSGEEQIAGSLGLTGLKAGDADGLAPLFAMLAGEGLPIVGLTTGQPGEGADDRLPDKAVHHRATTRLLEWIERLAASS
jgi:hypothetical protein